MAQNSHDVVVIGGGQAGLAVGYHLARQDIDFVILEAHERIGERWRRRWDSLRLFTPARFSALPGMAFPAPPHHYPTKDEVADYLEAYARQMELPVRTGARVERLARSDGSQLAFVVQVGSETLVAGQVVLAAGAYQSPYLPDFAAQFESGIRQLHSSEYRNPGQLQPGDVLVVGASNSGAEIAYEVAREHRTWLSGRDTGQIPFAIEGRVDRLVTPIVWFVFSRVITRDTPIGRRALPSIIAQGEPLERFRKADLAAAGVQRVLARTEGVRDSLPALSDGRVLEVANVIWCTGFRHRFPWAELPLVDADGRPRHECGVATDVDGLYYIGLPGQYSVASSLIGGVGRDAAQLVRRIAARQRDRRLPTPASAIA